MTLQTEGAIDLKDIATELDDEGRPFLLYTDDVFELSGKETPPPTSPFLITDLYGKSDRVIGSCYSFWGVNPVDVYPVDLLCKTYDGEAALIMDGYYLKLLSSSILYVTVPDVYASGVCVSPTFYIYINGVAVYSKQCSHSYMHDGDTYVFYLDETILMDEDESSEVVVTFGWDTGHTYVGYGQDDYMTGYKLVVSKVYMDYNASDEPTIDYGLNYYEAGHDVNITIQNINWGRGGTGSDSSELDHTYYSSAIITGNARYLALNDDSYLNLYGPDSSGLGIILNGVTVAEIRLDADLFNENMYLDELILMNQNDIEDIEVKLYYSTGRYEISTSGQGQYEYANMLNWTQLDFDIENDGDSPTVNYNPTNYDK